MQSQHRQTKEVNFDMFEYSMSYDTDVVATMSFDKVIVREHQLGWVSHPVRLRCRNVSKCSLCPCPSIASNYTPIYISDSISQEDLWDLNTSCEMLLFLVSNINCSNSFNHPDASASTCRRKPRVLKKKPKQHRSARDAHPARWERAIHGGSPSKGWCLNPKGVA